MSNRGLILGPWVGEFGWELFAWQGYCRTVASHFDYTIVISRPGNDYLYSDFCDQYLPFEPPPEGISDSSQNSAITSFNVEQFLKANVEIEILEKFSWNCVTGCHIGFPPYDHWKAPANFPNIGGVVPTYKKYDGKSPETEFDVIIHARNRKSTRTNDNWNVESWEKLVSMLTEKNMSVASIGTANQSSHIKGTSDMRGVSLYESCGLLSSAKCIVGPSSGPMHLASLSGCSQVVWTGNPNQNYSRYKYFWNPFETKVEMLMHDNPSSEDVFAKIMKIVRQ